MSRSQHPSFTRHRYQGVSGVSSVRLRNQVVGGTGFTEAPSPEVHICRLQRMHVAAQQISWEERDSQHNQQNLKSKMVT